MLIFETLNNGISFGFTVPSGVCGNKIIKWVLKE